MRWKMHTVNWQHLHLIIAGARVPKIMLFYAVGMPQPNHMYHGFSCRVKSASAQEGDYTAVANIMSDMDFLVVISTPSLVGSNVQIST
jgi:hypothetical protein